jgi:hypothetical protein
MATLGPIESAGDEIENVKRQRKEMASRFKLIQKR